MDELMKRYGDVGWAQVWKSWRDKMLAQGREVRPELMDIPIPPRDKELDATIASEVVDDFLTWASAHCNLKLVDAAKLQKATEMLRETGFIVVFDARTGRHYLECRKCKGDNSEPTQDSLDPTQVRHAADCPLAALLREMG